MLELHADPITINCRKVLAGLQLMDAPYKLVHVDYFKGAQKEMPYIGLNPNASVPALRDGDFELWESNAILMYAADKLGTPAAQNAYPSNLQVRSDINRWLLWESSSWFAACYVYLVENCVKPLLGGAADAAVLEAHNAQFHKLASILDARLARHQWVAGTANPTIADIALAAPLHLHGWQQIPFAQHTHIKRWMFEGVEKLPCWHNTYVGEGFSLEPIAA